MKRTRSIVLGALMASAVLFSFNSCKKCTVAEENSDTGIIVKDVVIYPQSGYITQNMGGYYHFDGSSYGDKFEVSFDGGYTKVPVDWNTYDILANPMKVDCKASFVRDVTIDNVLGYVFYKVTASACESCDKQRFVENYVLVPKIPSGYQVFFETDINQN